MIICIDFEGTIVFPRFPDITREVPGAFISMLKLLRQGHDLILYTMRYDNDEQDYLTDAINYCRDKGIVFFGANENPEQDRWTESKKPYAHFYIDDKAIGCPLIYPKNAKPYADWDLIMRLLAERIQIMKRFY